MGEQRGIGEDFFNVTFEVTNNEISRQHQGGGGEFVIQCIRKTYLRRAPSFQVRYEQNVDNRSKKDLSTK